MRAVPDPDPRCGHRMGFRYGPWRPHSAWNVAEETPVVQEVAPHPGVPPTPGLRAGGLRHPLGTGWPLHLSTCRSDLRKTQRQGSPQSEGFWKDPRGAPVPSLWCDSPTRTVSIELMWRLTRKLVARLPCSTSLRAALSQDPGLPVVGPRAEAMGLGPWPPPARGGPGSQSPGPALCWPLLIISSPSTQLPQVPVYLGTLPSALGAL